MPAAGWLLINIALAWFIIGPLVTLIHEMGHAVAALALGREPVSVRVGPAPARLRLSVGRLRLLLGLRGGFYGFYEYDDRGLSRAARSIVIAAGPLASLVLATLCFAVAVGLGGGARWASTPVSIAAMAAIVQGVITALPLRYPKFWGEYAGLSSDGARLRLVLAERASPSRRTPPPGDEDASDRASR